MQPNEFIAFPCSRHLSFLITTARVASLLREEGVGGPAAGRRRHHPPVGEEGPVAEVEGAAQEGGRHLPDSLYGRDVIRWKNKLQVKSKCLNAPPSAGSDNCLKTGTERLGTGR